MALDGSILSRAKQTIAKHRQDNEAEQIRRTAKIYNEIPKIKTIDEDIRRTMTDVLSAVLSKSPEAQKTVKKLGEQNLYLQEERKKALTDAGYPADYLDDKYTCTLCSDTGYVGTKPCSCLMDEYKKEQNREITSLMHLTDESFDTFDLKCYKNEYDEAFKTNPRQHMSTVYTACRLYAENFGAGHKNLLMTGSPGLGKTFLSACIARTVANSGKYSVVYRTCGEICSAYERARFGHDEEQENAKAELARYRTCDLLIMDDLGTELTTAMTIASLYELINNRLLSGGKTIISTNLKPDAIAAKYSPQIASRLSGDYQVLRFCGDDIRHQKKRYE